jgi:hypothetical protein
MAVIPKNGCFSKEKPSHAMAVFSCLPFKHTVKGADCQETVVNIKGRVLLVKVVCFV